MKPKKIIFLLILLSFIVFEILSTVFAESDIISVFINGKEIKADIPTQKIGGWVMVPAKFIAEPLGGTVRWDGAEQTVVITKQVPLENELEENSGAFKPTDIFVHNNLTDWDNLGAITRIHGSVMGSGRANMMDSRLQSYVSQGDLIQGVVDKVHQAGLKYAARISTDDSQYTGVSAAYVLNIDKRPVFATDYPPRPWLTIFEPGLRQHTIDQAKGAVDSGADILAIDTMSLQYDVASFKNGDFSERSMSGFREYLKKEYSSNMLKSFGVVAVDNFDYGEFIRQKYYNLYKENRLAVPLFNDFLNFQLQASLDFWAQLIKEVRAYAQEQGKQIFFTVNAPESSNTGNYDVIKALPIAGLVDGFTSEYPFGNPPDRKAIPAYKLYHGLGKPAALEIGTFSTKKIYSRPDAAKLIGLYTAEAYAAGGFVYAPFSDLIYEDDVFKPYSPEMDELYPIYDFIYNNEPVYDDLISTAKIGVLYSYPSVRRHQPSPGSDSFFGLSNLLLDIHRQYDVVFAGDDRWIKDSLTLDQLNQYGVVILPATQNLADRQVDLLLAYVQGGGNILSFGEIGTLDATGSPRERKQLQELLVGSRKYGLGRFVHLTGDVGSRYLSDKDLKARQEVSDALQQLVEEDIKTNASTNVALLEYWNKEIESDIIHLINYDYDAGAQRYKPQDNVEITVNLVSRLWGKKFNVFYVSPGSDNIQELNFTVSGNSISFRVPSLEMYGVVVIGEKDRFEASRQIARLKKTIKYPNADIRGQHQIAEEAYTRGDYTAAIQTAKLALIRLEKPPAEAVLAKAKETTTWWERAGRIYRLEAAKRKLQAAEQAYAAGNYQISLGASVEATGLLQFAIDGKTDDWAGIKPLSLTIIDKTSDEKPHIEDIRMTNDQDYLYLVIKLINASAEPNLELNLIVKGNGDRRGSKIFANNYQAQISAGGMKQELTKSVKEGLFELKIPLSLLGANRGKIEFTISSSSGAPHLPLSSRVMGDKVMTSYEVIYMP